MVAPHLPPFQRLQEAEFVEQQLEVGGEKLLLLLFPSSGKAIKWAAGDDSGPGKEEWMLHSAPGIHPAPQLPKEKPIMQEGGWGEDILRMPQIVIK